MQPKKNIRRLVEFILFVQVFSSVESSLQLKKMFLIVIGVVALSYLYYQRHRQMTIFERLGIPGPKPNFIFGNSMEIAKEGLVKIFPKWTKQYGPIVGFYIGGIPQILVTDLALIRKIMISDFDNFINRNQIIPGGTFPETALQKMLVFTTDDEWRHLRATESPTFSSGKLRKMEPLMTLGIDNIKNELDEKSKSDQEFNITPYIAELTFSTSAMCILGLDLSLNKMSKDIEAILETVQPRFDKSILAMTMLLFPSTSFIAYPLRLLWENLRFHKLWSSHGVCYDIARKVVDFRKSNELKSNDFVQLLLDAKRVLSKASNNDLEMSEKGPSTSDKLSSHDRSNEGLGEQEIVSNVMMFLLAGYETTSTSMQFTIQNLINNQDVQEKLRSQLREAMNRNDGKITLEMISTVPLLSHVIKESLRMHPPVAPFTSRVAKNDYDYNGVKIPRGMGVFIGVSSIHNDPEVWQEPEKFKPERFATDYDKLTWLPFGTG